MIEMVGLASVAFKLDLVSHHFRRLHSAGISHLPEYHSLRTIVYVDEVFPSTSICATEFRLPPRDPFDSSDFCKPAAPKVAPHSDATLPLVGNF